MHYCKLLPEKHWKKIWKKAKEAGADIALFPEMWSNGYRIYDRQAEEWKAEAICADSEFIRAFGCLTRELEMAIGVTLLEKWENALRNSLILFDPFGERKLTYAKVHTCDFGAEKNLTPGEDFYVTELDTACGNMKVGAMICYDREFPESARILMLKGAELILVPNACPMEINRLSQLRARAYENMMAIATCNYPKTVPDCNRGSGVFDGWHTFPTWILRGIPVSCRRAKRKEFISPSLIYNSFAPIAA